MRLAALDPGRRDDVGSTPPISHTWTARVCGWRETNGAVSKLFSGSGTYWLMILYGVELRKIGRKKKSEECELGRGVWKLAGPSLLISHDNYHAPSKFTPCLDQSVALSPKLANLRHSSRESSEDYR